MERIEAEWLFVPYLLEAIDEVERRLMDKNLESCGACRVVLHGYGETVASFALELPQLEAPLQVRDRLLQRVERDGRLARVASELVTRAGVIARALDRAFMPHVGKAVASVTIMGVVFPGVWFNDHLSLLSQHNNELTDQLQAAQQRETEIINAAKTQQYLTYEALQMSANPGTSVNVLRGTRAWDDDDVTDRNQGSPPGGRPPSFARRQRFSGLTYQGPDQIQRWMGHGGLDGARLLSYSWLHLGTLTSRLIASNLSEAASTQLG